jgi:hypothetical protein
VLEVINGDSAELLGEDLREARTVPKVLHFMLHSSRGCDASISADGFLIRFGWNPGPHRYFLQIAPGIVSQLLRSCGYREAPTGISAVLDLSSVPERRGFPPWPHERRLLWLRVRPDEVFLSIRADDALHRQDAWPDPIPPLALALRTMLTFPEPVVCPHCLHLCEEARVSAGRLICPRCARSFPAPA